MERQAAALVLNVSEFSRTGIIACQLNLHLYA